jgi:hypothetical protein
MFKTSWISAKKAYFYTGPCKEFLKQVELDPEIDRVAVIDQSGPIIDRSSRLLTSPLTQLDLVINRPTRSIQSTFGLNFRTDKFTIKDNNCGFVILAVILLILESSSYLATRNYIATY